MLKKVNTTLPTPVFLENNYQKEIQNDELLSPTASLPLFEKDSIDDSMNVTTNLRQQEQGTPKLDITQGTIEIEKLLAAQDVKIQQIRKSHED